MDREHEIQIRESTKAFILKVGMLLRFMNNVAVDRVERQGSRPPQAGGPKLNPAWLKLHP